jgi:hypothetical protein
MPQIQSQHATRSGGSPSRQVSEPPSDSADDVVQRRLIGPVDTHVSGGSRARAALVVTMVVAVLAGTGLIAVALNVGAAPAVGQPAPSSPSAPSTSVPTLTNQLPVPTPDAPTPPPATDCVPFQVCAPPTTTTTTPCVGEDCIPLPTTTAPEPDTPEQQDSEQAEELACGMTDFSGCVALGLNVAFRGLVEAALSPILELLAATALSTPTLDQLPGIGELWQNSFGLVLAVYGLLILIGGVVVMSHESLQTRYSIKEIGPRIPVAFLASMLSLFFVDKLIRLANAFSTAILGSDLNPPSLGDTLNEAMSGALTGGLFLILTALVLVVVGIGLLIVYVIRVMITVVLIISGPLFLMFHALPHTDPLAQWWWKATTAVLAIQVAQSLVLLVAVKTLLSGGVHLFTSFGSFGMMIGAIGLFIVLFKIPFWLFAAVKVGSGRSLIGGLARAYVAAKTFGMITGKSGARQARTATAASSSGGRGGAPADPPWPPPPRIAPTPTVVSRRLREQYDAERVRTARRSRLPSQAPRFLQPGAQATTHDPAIPPAAHRPAAPEFSAEASLGAPPALARRVGSRADAPRFEAPGTAQPARPIRVAAVPPPLRFQHPVSDPADLSRPARASTPPPPAPGFRSAHPEPPVGATRPRTPAVPPVTFRAPTSRRGGSTR